MRRFIVFLATCITLVCSAGLAHAYISVVSTYPLNDATGVDIAITDILVRFDTTILDENSFTGTGRNGHADRVTVNHRANYTSYLLDDAGGDYIRIHLNAPLQYSTTYTVSIDWRVQDTEGNNLGRFNSYTFQFTTMDAPATDTTPPRVLSTFPTNNATGVAITAVPSVTFSEIMNSSTIVTASSSDTTNVRLRNMTTNAYVYGGVVTMDATGTIAYFQPPANLAPNNQYRLRISADTGGAADLAGNILVNNGTSYWGEKVYDFFFTTAAVDTTPPTVTVTSPIAGATGVSIGTAITAKFSEAMDSTTITTSTFSVSGGVTGTVSYDAGTFTATFTPSAALAYGTNYTVTITTGVTDQAGNHMAANKVWTFTTIQANTPPPLNDYTQVPSFITNSTDVQPNVLLIVDNSGSMYEFAYKKAPDANCSDYGNSSSCRDDSYSSTKSYYGYFDSTQMYSYSTTGGGYFQVDTSKTLNKNSFWSGNFLNWLTMRRVDVIRKVLVGGKTQPRSANTANFLIPTEDPDRDHYKSYDNVNYTISAGSSTEKIYDETHNQTYNLQVYVGNQPPQDGLILNFSDKLRFGIMFFNDGYRFESNQNRVRDGGNLAVDIGSTGNNLITQIETTDPSTWTPLAETLYEAVRYFEATTSAYNGGTYSGKDPIQFRCQRNFVLVLTDGESTMDQNVPGTTFTGGTAVSDAYGFNIQTWMDRIATNEGYTSQKSTAANTDKGTYYLEGVAYYAHMTDLRSSTVGNGNLAGNQNLTIYTVFAFDDSAVGRDLLKKTAKYGGFNDTDNNGRPFTDSTCDPATRGASTRNPRCSEWNTSGDGVPDTYYEASEGSALEAALTKAFNSMLARVSSGTAASILSSSSGTGANILQAMFFPQRFFGDTAVDWIGELHSLWFYVDPLLWNSSIREDSDYTDTTRQADHFLDLKNDRVIDFRFDTASGSTVVDRYTDAKGDGKPDIDTNGDGVADSYTPFDSNVTIDDLRSIWKAGLLLQGRSPSTRSIYTQLSGSLVDFNYQSTGNTLDIGSYLDTTDSTVRNYLMAANQTEANKIIDFVRGTDQSGYRSRKTVPTDPNSVWKLGDIITSTPQQQTTYPLNDYDQPETLGGYNDSSYKAFYTKQAYQNHRGMVYVGVNDGMLHAFKMGVLTETPSGSLKATLSGPNLGEEEWAFIPRNSLPYLRYLTDTNYSGFNHMYFVDGSTVIKDVGIGIPTACGTYNYSTTDYSQCDKDFTDGTNYRTVLVGSMGLGGASRIQGSGCKTTSTSPTINGTCVETPTFDPLDNTKGLGYSSYFALDITNQSFNADGTLSNRPQLLWEFSDPALGFAMSGSAIVHISAKNADNTPNANKNGKWFAVVASGPMGPIDTSAQQFRGASIQPLTVFVLDLATGAKLATIDHLVDGTQLTNAFAGSITTAVADLDRKAGLRQYPGYYSDDVLYIGYVQNNTDGGVLRLVTNSDPDPTQWKLSKVIDGVGPVTNNIARLRRTNSSSSDLWLFFGTGRYYYVGDDLANRRMIAGFEEPCYRLMGQVFNVDYNCTTKLSLSDLTDQTSGTATISNHGWYIPLAAQDTVNNIGAERSITDPVSLLSQMIVFTTFAPSSDVCGFGGNSFLWGVQYDTGGAPLSGAKQARAVIQLSTGSIVQKNLTDLTGDGGRKSGSSDTMTGKAPPDRTTLLTKAGNKPVRKIIQIQEK